MAGTLEGGRKTAKTLKEQDSQYYVKIGRLGGKSGAKDGVIKGFAAMPREKVVAAGRKGGSRRK